MEPAAITDGVVTIRILFVILPFIMAAVHCLWRKATPGFSKTECFLIYFLVIGVGLQGILLGQLEIFHTEVVAGYIGYPDSPYLVQVGKAFTAFGFMGVLSFWFHSGWRSATAFGNALFLLMISYGHLRHLMESPETSDALRIILMCDSISAFALLALLILRKNRSIA